MMAHLHADPATKQGHTNQPPEPPPPRPAGERGVGRPRGESPSDGGGNAFRQVLMEPIEQEFAFLQQLVLAIEDRLEPLVEFALKDLRQIFQQGLVGVDLRLGGLERIAGGQVLLFLILVAGHRRRIQKAG